MDNSQSPAYPVTSNNGLTGLTKLEAYTLAAMQGMLSASWHTDSSMHEKIAELAVNAARATLSELSKNQQG